MSTEEELRKELEVNPGAPAFVELAEYLRKRNRHIEGIEVSLNGLNAKPEDLLGRLSLTRSYYEKGLLSFAVRELEELQKYAPSLKNIPKLIEVLAPDRLSHGDDSPGTVAEAEIDVDLVLSKEDSDDPNNFN